MRLMGLDYGSKTVGVAVSDPLGLTAQGVETVWRKQENKLRQTMARIEELISEYQVERIVLGYPKNMNNTVGERAVKSLEFKEKLEKRTGLPVAEIVHGNKGKTTVFCNVLQPRIQGHQCFYGAAAADTECLRVFLIRMLQEIMVVFHLAE